MKEGWKCPVCNSVYAPFVRECEKCNVDTDEVHYIHKFEENDNVPDSDVMFKEESPEELRKAGDARKAVSDEYKKYKAI